MKRHAAEWLFKGVSEGRIDVLRVFSYMQQAQRHHRDSMPVLTSLCLGLCVSIGV